jgi:hypothetical protein
MRRLVYTLVLFGMLSGCNSPKEPLQKAGCEQYYRGNTTEAFKVLQAAKIFRIGPVGYGGDIPPEEIALCKIIKRDDSSAILKELYTTGTQASRLYALLGLRFVNKAKYDELMLQMKTQNGEIETQSGCIGSRQTMQDIIYSIEAGWFDSDIQRELKNKIN